MVYSRNKISSSTKNYNGTLQVIRKDDVIVTSHHATTYSISTMRVSLVQYFIVVAGSLVSFAMGNNEHVVIETQNVTKLDIIPG